MKHKRELGEKFTTNESAKVRMRRRLRGERRPAEPRTSMDRLRQRAAETTLVLPAEYWTRI